MALSPFNLAVRVSDFAEQSKKPIYIASPRQRQHRFHKRDAIEALQRGDKHFRLIHRADQRIDEVRRAKHPRGDRFHALPNSGPDAGVLEKLPDLFVIELVNPILG